MELREKISATIPPPLQSLCSDSHLEPLAGTAKNAHTYILVEKPGSWSKDILDGNTFNAADTEVLAQLPQVLLIRRPGRAGHQVNSDGGFRIYIVYVAAGIVEMAQINQISDLLDFDFSGPGHNGGRTTVVEEPVVLVCAHAKRDRCCAIKGRPIARHLYERFPQGHIWECSHTGGHRFAPSLILFPWGYFYGRFDEEDALRIYMEAQAGRLYLQGNRGRGLWDKRGQVAELAVRNHLAAQGESLPIGATGVVDTMVTLADGRVFDSELIARTVDNAHISCTKPPKSVDIWVATEVRQRL
ncbi:sucrase ferredoxin [Corynebacterium sp. ES2794-CONJ1]|uniref:sucrase ferredoxin n=1 Tax=Corynebacterium sp. ES2794-CONJ1 TaxID=2980553 RepID=UPI0021DB03D4|nr:sucrase ferredoxin [Corynebacterium sp. ES2794-CONJ1]MCU9518847.1 sucrase ferredoxin [Corynebacterium sp. ES2794-CONJ1]